MKIMKKTIYLLALLFASFAFVACSDDDDDSKRINYAEIPAESKAFIEEHFGVNGVFDENEIREVELESNGSYEVKFKNGIEIDFYSNGVWKDIDLNKNVLPNSIAMLIQPNALNYISANYPNAVIEEIEKIEVYSEAQDFKIELRGDRDIYFDYQGNVLKDKGQTSQGGQNVVLTELPILSQTFLETYFKGMTPSKIELEWNKYEVVFNEDKVNEVEAEFFKDGTFKSVDTDGADDILRAIIKGETKSSLILDYLAKNHASNRIGEFSVAPAILGEAMKGGYIVELDGRPEYKVYFNASLEHVRTIID